MVRVNAEDVSFFGFDTAGKTLPSRRRGWGDSRLDGNGRRRFQDPLDELKQRFGQRLSFAL